MAETLVAETADCLLTITASQPSTGMLQLHYTVRNRSAASLYLCSQLSDSTQSAPGPPSAQPDPVHIQIESGGVLLDMSVMDLSFRSDLKALDMPLLRELPAGEATTQTIQLALPLQPYRVDGQHPGQSAPVLLPMRFALGYFPNTPELLAALEPVSPHFYQVLMPSSRRLAVVAAGPFTDMVAVANAVPATVPPAPASPEHWTPWS